MPGTDENYGNTPLVNTWKAVIVNDSSVHLSLNIWFQWQLKSAGFGVCFWLFFFFFLSQIRFSSSQQFCVLPLVENSPIILFSLYPDDHSPSSSRHDDRWQQERCCVRADWWVIPWASVGSGQPAWGQRQCTLFLFSLAVTLLWSLGPL